MIGKLGLTIFREASHVEMLWKNEGGVSFAVSRDHSDPEAKKSAAATIHGHKSSQHANVVNYVSSEKEKEERAKRTVCGLQCV
jgi:hypothetical protein